jgi:hypothetical protein
MVKSVTNPKIPETMKTRKLLPLAIIAFSPLLMTTSCKDSNGDPYIATVKINPDGVHANGYVKIAVTADDPDRDLLTYTYEVSGGTVVEDGSNAYWQLPSNAGSASVKVTATDPYGAEASESKSVTVLEPVTQISGYAKLGPNETGNIDGSKVYLHGSTVKIFESTGSGNSLVFNLTGIDPGTYTMNIWRDTDGSGDASFGDYMGWYGTGGIWSPDMDFITVAEGQTSKCEIVMYHPMQ